jgi:two-component system cell cycle response regulator
VSTLLDNRSLYFASITDTVTGLFNRRFFDSRFGIECMRATEKRMPLTLLLIDIDHFKKINDDHGHQAGDAVLNTLGQVIKRRIRGSDIGARVGGEEFAVVLPDTSPIDALIVAENLRKQVSEMNVAVHGLNKEIKVTISIGVAGYKWATDNQNSLYKHAEEALERAKADGRNKIISAEPPAA